ncbi:MAG TPA: tetratricopeptide repeat protein [Bryobacteraceae bacterium]
MPELTTYKQRTAGPRELGGILHHLGRQLVTAGRFDEARQSLELSLDLSPGRAGCHFDLGNVLYSNGTLEHAIAEYRHAVRLDPRLAPAWYNLGVALMQNGGMMKEAEHAYRRALRFSPDQPETHNNLAILLQSAGRGREAIQHYRTAASLRPGYQEPRFNLGCLLQDLGRLEEARQVFEELLADCPDHKEASNNLANVLTELGRHGQARARFERVLALDPEHRLSRWNLGLNQLRTGDWAAGWKNYEARLRQSGARSQRPMWQGAPLDGARLLLTAEQGMGDLLQTVRFVREVAARGARTQIECHGPLSGLFERIDGVEQVVEVGSDLPAHDYWLPMMSLPHVLGTTLETLKGHRTAFPYLSGDPQRIEHWRERLAAWHGLRVGFVWSGNPKFLINARRSLAGQDVKRFCQLVRGKGVRNSTETPVHLFNLQKGVPAPIGSGLIALDDDPSAMDDLAAVILNLDLVVTVDTSVAHLAGALGRPVWTMLAFHADWRWMTADYAHSPWYPTMRLFRQTKQGDWSNVLEEVGAEIGAMRVATGR